MDVVKTIEEIQYNSRYWWDISINPYASVGNGLADCTCFVFGAVLFSNLPAPTKWGTYEARSWHTRLANGWTHAPYEDYKRNIKIGDVIEWDSGNHVAIVSDIRNGEIWISGSFYTGVNGKAYVDGKYDTREGISSLKQLNDFMVKNYQYRFFHFVPLATESQWCGGEPDYVLISPNSIIPTKKDIAKNQIYVGVTGLRVRTEPNTSSMVLGTASVGYYDVVETVTGGDFGEGNTWYKIDDLYVAAVNGVRYYPKEEIAPLEEMVELMKKMQTAYLGVCNERDGYKDKLDKIRGILDE